MRCDRREQNKEAAERERALKVKRAARPMAIVNRMGPVAKGRFGRATPGVRAEAAEREKRRREATWALPGRPPQAAGARAWRGVVTTAWW